jgi:O-acetyl-ADP-ribose deacetylase (regulator of RNase III)
MESPKNTIRSVGFTATGAACAGVDIAAINKAIMSELRG